MATLTHYALDEGGPKRLGVVVDEGGGCLLMWKRKPASLPVLVAAAVSFLALDWLSGARGAVLLGSFGWAGLFLHAAYRARGFIDEHALKTLASTTAGVSGGSSPASARRGG